MHQSQGSQFFSGALQRALRVERERGGRGEGVSSSSSSSASSVSSSFPMPQMPPPQGLHMHMRRHTQPQPRSQSQQCRQPQQHTHIQPHTQYQQHYQQQRNHLQEQQPWSMPPPVVYMPAPQAVSRTEAHVQTPTTTPLLPLAPPNIPNTIKSEQRAEATGPLSQEVRARMEENRQHASALQRKHEAAAVTPRVERGVSSSSSSSSAPSSTPSSSPSPPAASTGHVIICIDISGSMRSEGRMTQTFECVLELMTEQLKAVNDTTKQLYSFISFNTHAYVEFQERLLDEDLIRQVKGLRRTLQPRLGTDYSCALEKVQDILHTGLTCDFYFLVFLSDGRPGDLLHLATLPPIGSEKTTYKVNGEVRPSATFRMVSIAKKLKKLLFLNTIGIGESAEMQWLERLAVLSKLEGCTGKYTHSKVSAVIRNDTGSNITVDICSRNGGDIDTRDATNSPDDFDEGADDMFDDDEVQFLGYGGTVSKKRKQRPINLISQTQRSQQSHTGSLRATFRDISSTLTQTQTQTQTQSQQLHSSASSPSGKRVAQREVEFEDKDEWLEDEAWKGESHVDVDRMQLVGGIKFEADKSKGSFSVRLRDLPFAQGGERNAYHLFIDACSSTANSSAVDEHYVAKESRMEEHFKDRLKFHLPHFLTWKKSHELSIEFNRATAEVRRTKGASSSPPLPAISFLPMSIFRIRDNLASGGFRYLSAEPFMQGQFTKFNGNNGYIYNTSSSQASKTCEKDKSISVFNDLAQAFSHWTYQYTLACREHVLVCDIQGDGFTCTDPTICSITTSSSSCESSSIGYGKSNMGLKGFENFFRTHVCNDICRELKLNASYTGRERVSTHRHLVADRFG